MKPIILAHRGDTTNAPENSLSAIRMAAATGYDGVECDVRVSADKQPFIFHDSTLDRMTGETGNIDEREWKDIKQLQLKDSEESIPHLEDVLQISRRFCMVNFEIKAEAARSQPIFQALSNAIQEKRINSPQICLSSFDPKALEEAHHILPNVRRGLVVEKPLPEHLDILRSGIASIYIVGIQHIDTLDEAFKFFETWTWTAKSSEDISRVTKQRLAQGIISDYLKQPSSYHK